MAVAIVFAKRKGSFDLGIVCGVVGGLSQKARLTDEEDYQIRAIPCTSDSWIDPNSAMANTKYAYVRDFELPDPLLPGTFMLFRLDGHSFHR